MIIFTQALTSLHNNIPRSRGRDALKFHVVPVAESWQGLLLFLFCVAVAFSFVDFILLGFYWLVVIFLSFDCYVWFIFLFVIDCLFTFFCVCIFVIVAV